MNEIVDDNLELNRWNDGAFLDYRSWVAPKIDALHHLIKPRVQTAIRSVVVTFPWSACIRING